MAKLSERQRNNILALWDTGSFTKTAIAKKYKVSEKIIRNIVDGNAPKNKALVDEQLLLNERKKSELSPIEIKAVNNAVEVLEKNKEYIQRLTTLNLNGLEAMIKRGSFKKPIKMKNGDFDVIEQHEQELTTVDYKNAQDTIDKAMITYGEAPRHANSQINVNTQNNMQQNTELNREIVSQTLENFENEY